MPALAELLARAALGTCQQMQGWLAEVGRAEGCLESFPHSLEAPSLAMPDFLLRARKTGSNLVRPGAALCTKQSAGASISSVIKWEEKS